MNGTHRIPSKGAVVSTETSRQTPAVTELTEHYQLPAGSQERFDKDGFVRLPGVLSAETIAAYEPEITDKVIERNTMHLPLPERSTYDKAFLQVENLWEHSATVREFVFALRLARIAAELLGVEAVALYHDQALYKEAGGGITPWHADEFYWPFATDRCCTAWVPLQETPAEMGPLAFSVGSQAFTFGRDLGISDHSESELQRELSAQGFPVYDEPYRLGDVSYHLGWTFHRAEPNRTEIPRRVMTVIYVDADMELVEAANDNQRSDFATWLPGLVPGDKPSSPRNPELYRHTG
jgi:ectoine hydroxylase-related dioxygenase (phytanoyl-CoA dioxygenase family)